MCMGGGEVCVCVCVCMIDQDVLLQPDVFYIVREVFSVLRYVCSEYPSLMILLILECQEE